MFKKVLYPVDVEEGGFCEDLLHDVLGEVRKAGASLYLMYVMPGFGTPLVASFFPAGAVKRAVAAAKEHMEEFVKTRIPEDIDVHAIVREGSPYEEILDEAEKNQIDLIIIPSHNREGVDRWLLGSTAAKVVRHAQCSVMVLRQSKYT